MGALRRIVLGSLASRVALILIAGLFCAQMLTSTVWFDRRHRALMDAPNRIVAVRVGDAVRLASGPGGVSPAQALAPLQTTFFRATMVSTPERAAGKIGIDGNAIRIMRTIIEEEAGPVAGLRVTQADILGDDGRVAGMSALLCAREPRGRYTLFVAAPGRTFWLRVDALEGQHGAGTHCLTTVVDYVLRIYLLRMAIITVIALLAVRMAMQPLTRMIKAAEGLGHNIRRPPLATDGPREVRQAAEAFNTMQARLLQAMEERSHFLAAVSHDLRAPITRMRLRTETQLPEALRERFRRDLLDMEGLVNSTLSIIQDSPGGEGAVTLDLTAVLQELVQAMREQGGAVTLDGAQMAVMKGYPQSLKRCFQNLLDNALRYAGMARVTLAVEEAWVRVMVCDDGPGIPPEQLERVLEPFYRLEESRGAATGGFGLGLSIVAKVVQGHGGNLALRNLDAGGLAVEVALPKMADDRGK